MFGRSKFSTLINVIYLRFHLFAIIHVGLYKVCKICIDHKVLLNCLICIWCFHAYESNQRWHSNQSHISIIPEISTKKREMCFIIIILFCCCCWCHSYCVSYVPLLLYIWWISVKSIVRLSVLERKMCNVISYNNSSRQCYFYLYSKCIFLLSDIIFSTKIQKKNPLDSWGVPVLLHIKASLHDLFRNDWQLFIFSKLNCTGTWIMQEFGSIGLWQSILLLLLLFLLNKCMPHHAVSV